VSIYRSKDLMYTKHVHQIQERPNVNEPGRPPTSGEWQDWSQQRKARPADVMLPLSDKWFDELPTHVRPCALVTYYPRIANLLALQWNNRSACSAYFHGLLTDLRGGRQGFPKAVHRDLMQLRDYWFSL